jgi:hypothetical protein
MLLRQDKECGPKVQAHRPRGYNIHYPLRQIHPLRQQPRIETCVRPGASQIFLFPQLPQFQLYTPIITKTLKPPHSRHLPNQTKSILSRRLFACHYPTMSLRCTGKFLISPPHLHDLCRVLLLHPSPSLRQDLHPQIHHRLRLFPLHIDFLRSPASLMARPLVILLPLRHLPA